MSEQSVVLQKTEWLVYTFNSLDKNKHSLTITATAPEMQADITIWINGRKVNCEVSNKALTELPVGEFELNMGKNTVKIEVNSNTLIFDRFTFK